MKSQSTIAIAMIFLASLAGCRSAFQPPSATFLLWSKEGEDATAIKKALLECGDPNPYDGMDREWIDGKHVTYTTVEDSAASELCMEKNSYRKNRARRLCDSIRDVQICKPENQHAIPERSVSRRLNSKFCKRQAEPAICMP